MEHDPLVTIIIPVYGTEQYLPGCIASVCGQSYSKLEIILVDDQSPDRSGEICDEFARKDPRITVIHQVNKGVSGARNSGLSRAKGEYIMFVDSDDALEENAVELLLQDILKYHADMACASKCMVSPDGTLRYSANDGELQVYEGEQMIALSLDYERHTRSLHAKLFDRGFLGEIRFSEGHNLNEDGYFLFECYAKQPKVVQHNVSIYRYFFREDSASNSSFSEKYCDMLYFCDLKMAYIREKMPHFLENAKNMEVRTNLLFLQALCRCADKKYRQLQKHCVQTVRRSYRYHRPISDHHRLLAWLVVHGLYPVYKLAVRMKYYR